MKTSFLRARPWGTALAFFAVGVLFASAMDWTPSTHAQNSQATRPSAAALKSLGETSDAFVAIAEQVTPAVVAIQTRTEPRVVRGRGQQTPPPDIQRVPPELRPFIEQFGGGGAPRAQEASGSGFILTPDGYIVTNRHVVTGADQITVVLNDRHRYRATLVGEDAQTDVAVIKIDAKNLPAVSLGDDERLRIGEWVLAIGNPLGLDFTVTAGIVSAKGRNSNEVPVNLGNQWAITDFIQTDAAINMGNSGGPLVNIRGEVVGINTAIASSTGRYEGYGFAIPVGLARAVWRDLIEHGTVRRAVLGVNITDVQEADAKAAGLSEISGVLVRGCADESSAACKAGVQEGDVVTSIDGVRVSRVSALQRAVRAKKPGESVAIKLHRYGKEHTINVRLAAADDAPRIASGAGGTLPGASGPTAKLGLDLEEQAATTAANASRSASANRGLRVVGVDPAGPARGQLFVDDVIVGVMPSGEAIRTNADMQRLLNGKKAGDALSLKVNRRYVDNTGMERDQSVVVNLLIGG